eukprot:TRINITY_DN2505_c0_g1_i1.p1 TRINITY_DN2505_c0_g1~~TRINITY_DN2505_c0_g1_i1.p1  ORF type:complete len:312 (+),score=41.72 TRINITY_DN2505_c0_g1_i1:91-1026(+)
MDDIKRRSHQYVTNEWKSELGKLEKACLSNSKDSIKACQELLTHPLMIAAQSKGKTSARLKQVLTKLCENNDLQGCAFIAAIDEESGNKKLAEKSSQRVAQCFDIVSKKCDAQDLESCNSLGEFLLMMEETDSALDIFQQTCDLKDAKGCMYLGIAQLPQDQDDEDAIGTAYKSFSKGCHLGNGRSCGFLSEIMHEKSESETISKANKIKELRSSVPFVEKALKLGDCTQQIEWLAESYFKGTDWAPKDVNKAREYAKRSCECFLPGGCNIYAKILQSAPGSNVEEIKNSLLLSCGLGEEEACRSLSRLRE